MKVTLGASNASSCLCRQLACQLAAITNCLILNYFKDQARSAGVSLAQSGSLIGEGKNRGGARGGVGGVEKTFFRHPPPAPAAPDFHGMSAIEAFICCECGEGVEVVRSVQRAR